MEKPLHYGTWKGRVISSIVFDGARSWEDIQEITGLNSKQLNSTLKEMFRSGVLERDDRLPYKVQYDIYKQYQAFEQQKDNTETRQKTRVKKVSRVSLRAWIGDWIKLKGLNVNMDKDHFFLEGRYLDELSKDLIQKGSSEVLIVNPFVSETDLAKSMIEPAKSGIKVTLITRYNDKYKVFHDILKDKGVYIRYDSAVHAKLIVVDRAVAFVSSMNFIPTSSSGQSWEAGIVTLDEAVISDALDSIYELLER